MVLDEKHLKISNKTKKITWEKWEEVIVQSNETIIEEFLDEEEEEPISIDFNLGPAKIKTPLGDYAASDPFMPSKMFDCWIGHTNFDINSEVAETIENTEGVEAFRVMSRYRFFIGVGTQFTFRDISQSIQNRLIKNTEKIVKSAFVIKNGTIEFLSSDKRNLKKFQSTLESLEKEKDTKVIILD